LQQLTKGTRCGRGEEKGVREMRGGVDRFGIMFVGNPRKRERQRESVQS